MKKLITISLAIILIMAFCFIYVPETKASDSHNIADFQTKLDELKQIQNKIVTNPSPGRRVADVTIDTDTTWSTNQSFSENVYVDAGVTLTINPGVTVQFAEGYGLYVNGNLVAIGTNSQPITFTSPSPPDNYYGIFGNPGSDMVFNHCIVDYAGQQIGPDTYTAGITVQGLFSVQNCAFSNSALLNIGIMVSSNASIISNTFADSSLIGAIIYNVSNLVITDNVFQNELNGVLLSGTTQGLVSNNEFTNGLFGLSVINTTNVTINGGNNFNGCTLGVEVEDDAQAIVSDNIINNNVFGIYLRDNSTVNVRENNINDNTRDGVFVLDEEGTTPTVIINYNDISGNDLYGVEVGTIVGEIIIGSQGNHIVSLPVLATKNYWGSDTGPTHTSNPGGIGDAVTDNVTFLPWLDLSYTTPPPINSVNLVDGQTVGGIYPINVDASWVVHVLPLDDMTKVDFYIDGVLMGTDTTAPYSYDWDTTVHASPHIVRIVATNVLGTTNERTVNVNVENALPYTGK